MGEGRAPADMREVPHKSPLTWGGGLGVGYQGRCHRLYCLPSVLGPRLSRRFMLKRFPGAPASPYSHYSERWMGIQETWAGVPGGMTARAPFLTNYSQT